HISPRSFRYENKSSILVICGTTFYFDFRTTSYLQLVGRGSLIQCKLYEPCASFKRKELARLSFRKVRVKAGDGQPCHADRESAAEIFTPEISNNVTELIDSKDRTKHSVAQKARSWELFFYEIQDAWTNHVDCYPPHQMRCNWRKDISPMKCLA